MHKDKKNSRALHFVDQSPQYYIHHPSQNKRNDFTFDRKMKMLFLKIHDFTFFSIFFRIQNG